MSETKACYIVTVGGGKCLDNQGAHGVLDCLPKNSDSQKWSIETDPTDQNVVAFKSSLDGQYLRNNEPAKVYYARIGVGEKQWWTLEKGKNPGSCLIRSNACTAGASYLNDFEGRYQDRNTVHMWAMDQNRQFWLDWYLLPTDAPFKPSETTAATASEEPEYDASQQKNAELDTREAELLEKERDLARRETALAQQASDDATRSEEPSSDAPQQKNAGLDAREAELLDKERDLAKREATLAQQASDASASVQSRSANDHSRRPNNNTADDDNQSASRIELLRAENENLKLNLKIQDLEEQLKNARTSQAVGNTREPTSGNAVPHSTTNYRGKGQPVVYECGHVAYPPPRKLRYHVVGMLYEGIDGPHELSGRQKATLAKHHHHS